MSCIYGPHQHGTEDQGWVAHFLIKALQREPITIYGDGTQVRDLLFVDDLVDAFLLAQKNIDYLAGNAFNIGGGPTNAISLLELIDKIAGLNRSRTLVRFDQSRAADQRYFVANTSKFESLTGWRPKVGVDEGVTQLHAWLKNEVSQPHTFAAPLLNGMQFRSRLNAYRQL
jgi:CDP-paratose 2-epimerase